MAGPATDQIKVSHKLMSELLALKSARFVDGHKIRTLVDRLGVNDIAARIYFLRELHDMTRKLPLKIFAEDQDRVRLLTAIQDALDEAIDQEEEELEE